MLEWHNEKRNISELIEFENNPRKLNDKAKQDLTNSLNKFNLVEIPVIDLDNTILAGHQRLKVLSILKGDVEIDVRVPNRALTKKEREEYLIRSNKNTGDWNWELLETAFDQEELIEWGFDEIDFDKNIGEEIDWGDEDFEAEKFKFSITCNEVDKIDAVKVVRKALLESGIEAHVYD